MRKSDQHETMEREPHAMGRDTHGKMPPQHSTKKSEPYVPPRTTSDLKKGEKCPECEFLWFEPESVPSNFACILYGQRRSGKTTWLKYFLWAHQSSFDRVVCFSSTQFKGEFAQFMNPNLCFPAYDEAALMAILDAQAATPEKERERVLVILDDVLDQEQKFRKRGDNALVKVYTMGRHYGISCIMCTQYAKAIPTSWRRNVDFALIFYTFSSDMADIYYKEYGALLSRSQFFSILAQTTKDHTGLVVRPCTKSRVIQDYYQITQAPHPKDIPKFYIGKPPVKSHDDSEHPNRFPEHVSAPPQPSVSSNTLRHAAPAA